MVSVTQSGRTEMIHDKGYHHGSDNVAIELGIKSRDGTAAVVNERNLRMRIHNKDESGHDTADEADLLAELIKYKIEKYGQESISGEDDALSAQDRVHKTIASICLKLRSYPPTEVGMVLQETHESILESCRTLYIFPDIEDDRNLDKP